MNNVIPFPAPRRSPLEPFLGTWIRDPISVSRHKVARRMLGEDGLKLLWDCGSMAELREQLRDDAALAAKYERLSHTGSEGRLVIAPRLMTWIESATAYSPGRSVNAPIARVAAEGRIIIVHAPPGGAVSGHALRLKGGWLFVTEWYASPDGENIPRSPLHRYYRAERGVVPAGAA